MPAAEKHRNIKALIWLYLWLWIFEGAIRKWVLPQLAGPLLIIRDPLVIGIYLLAIRAGIFPKNFFIKAIIFQAFVFSLGGFYTVITAEANLPVGVILFGIRTNFLHLPLIFIIAQLFNIDDVKCAGKWLLLLAAPMALLMVYQFNSPAENIINVGAGIGASQLASAGGKIRPAATFSYISAAAQYLGLVATFVIYGLFNSKVYPYWLLIVSGLSLVLAVSVSGSRTAIGMVAGVLLCLVVSFLVRPALLGKSYKFLVLICAVYIGITSTPVFYEGMEVLSSRAEDSGKAEASKGGILGRFFNDMLEPFNYVDQLPPLGYGPGVGTNVGAVLLTGKVQFTLSEGEWGRIIFESGVVLGLLYILLRIALVGWMGRVSIKNAAQGNVLPILLFGNCSLTFLNGQFSRSSDVGFAVLTAGLCLAAANCIFNKSGRSHENLTSKQLLT
jgi:diacylglycerol kinase